MRSVYTRVLLWCFGTLLLSLLAFVAISVYLSSRVIQDQGPFQKIANHLRDDCIAALKAGGKPGLEKLIAQQRERTALGLYLIDSGDHDVLTGEDRRALVTSPPSREIVVTSERQSSQDYRLIMAIPPPPFNILTFVPYYLLILAAVAGLLWLLAVNIGTPLRHVARAVDRFGAGDLDSRVELAVTRRDEIGDLGRTFNQMAARLQTLLNAERQLLQDISHELRSPLVRLSFAAELTRTAMDRDQAADRMMTEIERLASLVAGLLDVTRAEGEFPERNLQPVRVDILVNEIADSCEIEAMAKHCRLHRGIAGPLEMHGDAELLRRAVENVMSNAVRYAPEGTEIDLVVRVDDTTAVIAVRDRGPGVPNETLRKLFTPFYRLDDSRDSTTGGVGLGLAIAQRAVLLHHGQVTAENSNPGLTLTITIPIVNSPPVGSRSPLTSP